jgi:hypothetical protein
LNFFYPDMPKNAVYMIEDAHTCYWPEFGGGVNKPQSFMNVTKALIDKLNADHARGAVVPDSFTRDTFLFPFTTASWRSRKDTYSEKRRHTRERLIRSIE